MNQEPTKTCPKCQKSQNVVQFSRNRSRKDGIDCYCKKCVAIKSKHWQLKNPEKVKENSKRWAKANPEKMNAKSRQWRKNNPEKMQQCKQNWNQKNPEKVKNSHKKSYLKNRDQNKEKAQKRVQLWRVNNPEKVQANRKKAWEITKNDPILKIIGTQRLRIRQLLKRQNITKDHHTNEYIGCTDAELVQHLQSQFKNGMTLKNHGQFGWHIDHIQPLAKFDLHDPEQRQIAFWYTNLQPLWWYENLAKGST